jgi:hypothetical protein
VTSGGKRCGKGTPIIKKVQPSLFSKEKQRNKGKNKSLDIEQIYGHGSERASMSGVTVLAGCRQLGLLWTVQFSESSKQTETRSMEELCIVWIEDFLYATVQRYWKCNWKILHVILVVTEVTVSVLRSVARRWLVESENPSACATVNWSLCKSAIALYCLWIKV